MGVSGLDLGFICLTDILDSYDGCFCRVFAWLFCVWVGCVAVGFDVLLM